MYPIHDLYTLEHTLAADYLQQFTWPWEALKGIKDEIIRLGKALDPTQYREVSPQVRWLALGVLWAIRWS